MISYRNVSITLGGRRILDDISFSIESGETFCIVGRSGAGKSVMIKQLVGLLHPDEGQILFDGQNVVGLSEQEMSHVRRRCQMVFQHATLFDSMTCLENVALPLVKHLRLKPNAARQKALMYLSQVGVSSLADRSPSVLGPGLKKLVAIARSLTMEPDAILFDEPTTGLDPLAARKFDTLVNNSLKTSGMTKVVVSHDVRSIFEIADRVALLHEGRLRFFGTTKELESSTDSVVKNFITGNPAQEETV